MKIAVNFASTTFGILLLGSILPSVAAVTREECKNDYLPPLLECIDSFEGKGPPACDFLPVPDFAMSQNQANEMGYWIQPLRNTSTSHVFAVSEGAYLSMIVVDVPAETAVGKVRNLRMGGKVRDLQEDGMMEGPVEVSEDKAAEDGISVAFIDMPPTFIHPDGIGSHLISGLGDILGKLDASIEDVAKFEMIYTHGHMDHIGLATHTFDYITKTLGFDPSTVPVVAPQGVLEAMEHAIDAGFFSYRAPLPTVTFSTRKDHTLGSSTKLTLTTFEGHQYGDKDVIVFMESLGPENPAIMMVVDIVFPKWVPFYSFAISTDLLEYISAHDVLLEFPLGDDGYIVGGHMNQVGDRNDILLNQNLTLAILDAAQMALNTVDAGAVVGGTGAFTPGEPNYGNVWGGFDAFFDEITRVCARAVLEEYGCDFGGLDVTLYSQCLVAQSFWRVEV